MRRSFLALAVVTVLILAASVPASAATWIQLRYWGTSNDVLHFGVFPFPFTTNPAGLSIRRDLMNGMWALSFNFDTGAASGGFLGSTPDSYNRFWNLNLHRQWAVGTAMFSLYGGWGSVAVVLPNLWATGVEAAIRQSGLRVGTDVKVMVAPNWYLVGDFGYGPFGSNAQTNNWLANPAAGTETATLYDWHVGVGRSWGTWGLEAGWRGMHWVFTTTTTVCGGLTPCDFDWGGWYAGLNFTGP